MKKNIKRVLCFLLALVVMVSLPLNLHANAVALELGWVTWALISFLTASGFTFAATGGIEALQNEVEQQVDEYYTVTGIDLYQLIVQSLRMRPSNNGNGNGFWFGVGAVVAIGEFIEWVRSHGWGAGNHSDSLTYYKIPVIYTTGSNKDYVYYNSTVLGSYIATSSVNSSVRHYNVALLNDFLTISELPIKYKIDYDNRDSWYHALESDLTINYYNSSNTIVRSGNYDAVIESFGYTKSQVSGITFIYNLVNGIRFNDFYFLMNDKTVIGPLRETAAQGYCIFSRGTDPQTITVTSTITSPSEITEFEVQPDEYVEIDFEQFAEETTFAEPQELAEAVKDNMIDTGTIPSIKTDVVTEPAPSPAPTPVPTPVPTPEIEDIGELGLPALGEAIFNKFPFSLPKDLKRIASLLSAEPVTPKWEVDLYETLGNRVPFAGDTTISIDLEEYEVLGQISRWASVITFVIFLIIITKGVIRW